MIESPRILRLAFPEERCSPRIVGVDELPLVGSLRVTSSHELAAPLRRSILIARQAIVDSQRPDGMFGCLCGTTPRGVAEFLLAAAWLGLQDDLSLEPLFSDGVDLLIESQRPNGRWPSGSTDVDSLDTTFLVYLALKLFGVSITDETLDLARRSLLAAGGLVSLDRVARGYLALFGQAPFEKRWEKGEEMFSPTEERSWRKLLQQRVCRQLSFAETLVELQSTAPSKTRGSAVMGLLQRLGKRCRIAWDKAEHRSVLRKEPQPTAEGENEGTSYREILYSAMATEGPWGGIGRSAKLQYLCERLKDPAEGVDALSLPDVSLQASCLEAILLSGLPMDSVVVAKGIRILCQPSFTVSHADRALTLRVACLLQHADHQNESLPPPLQLAADEKLRTPDGETDDWLEQLVSSIPGRVAALFKAQWRKGSWEGCPVATAEALLALAAAEKDLGCEKIVDAIRFLRRTQLADGSWKSVRQGEQIMATAMVIAASRRVGLASSDPLVVRGISWLLAKQQPGGGWSDQVSASSASHTEEGFVSLQVTATVVGALVDCGYAMAPAVRIGIDTLFECDLFADDPTAEGHPPVSLVELCTTLCTLCRWASVENNGTEKHNTVVRSLALLSMHD